MKVKCIDNKSWKTWLTIDKIYDVIKIHDYGYYRIIDDIGIEDWFPKSRFRELTTLEMRNYKINKLLVDENNMH
jgi:hypothetical protein